MVRYPLKRMEKKKKKKREREKKKKEAKESTKKKQSSSLIFSLLPARIESSFETKRRTEWNIS